MGPHGPPPTPPGPRGPPEFFGEPGGRGELAKKFRGARGPWGGPMGPHGPQIYISFCEIVNFIVKLR